MTAIALPKGLKIDQMAALFLYVVKVLKGRLEDVDLYFGTGNHPENAVDIDCKTLYREKNNNSATEALAIEHGLLSVPGVLSLVRDLNLNNGRIGNKGGWLKQLPFAFGALIRNLWDMGMEREKTIRLYFRIFSIYFSFREKLERGEDVSREGWEEFFKTLPDIGESSHPLTLCGYAHTLWLLGKTDDQIRDEVRFWYQRFQEARQWKRAAVEGARRCEKRFFPLGSKRIVVISVSHPRIPGKLFRHNTVMVINHNPNDGSIAVLTQLPHGSLDELRKHLPGWHLERDYKYPMLLFGSQSRDSRGHPQTANRLVELIRQYVKVG